MESAVPFTEALIRIREDEGLYRLDEGSVSLIDQTLFRADVSLPANLVEGAYKTTHAAWPHLREQNFGRVIFTSSTAGLMTLAFRCLKVS